MLTALAIGALAAGSLVLGAVLALAHGWTRLQVAIVLAFGAGALISAVSFELAEEALKIGGLGWTAAGLAGGAATYYVLDGLVERRFPGGAGTSLALGAFLDGVPEQIVLGITIASGEGVGLGLLVAIFISNLPEATASASQMLAHSPSTRRRTSCAPRSTASPRARLS